jgi:hypothetical protein
VEQQDFYQRGIERLLDGISRFRVCLLCAEEDPARCPPPALESRGRSSAARGGPPHPWSGVALVEEELQADEGPAQLPLLAR